MNYKEIAHPVIEAEGYDRVDGRRAYGSLIKTLTLSMPILDENKAMEIALQMWQEKESGESELKSELAIHQVFDNMIVLARALIYFKDAYRMPGLYDKDQPIIDRIGLQGDAMTVGVCTDNPKLDEDIQSFDHAIGSVGEIIGERRRVLTALLTELNQL